MLSAADAALKSFLRTALPSTDVRISRSLDEGSAGTSPVVRVIARGIREDLSARTAAMWQDVRDDDGRVIARQPSLRRFRFHYQVVADAGDAEAEHAVLDAVLRAVAGAAPSMALELAVLDSTPPAERFTLDLAVTVSYTPPARTELASNPDSVVLGVRRGQEPGPVDHGPGRPHGVIREG